MIRRSTEEDAIMAQENEKYKQHTLPNKHYINKNDIDVSLKKK